ncbi:MAG TPA: hypothetical protein VMS86_06860 [Thermoanaerobaculia bacterium]|nr:hypothetical protein [Thermoanaerobaculia bacterium]
MRRPPFLVLSMFAALAVPNAAARAQQVYVPLTSYPGDGTVLELVATNPDTELTRVFSGVVLPEGADGVTTAGEATGAIGVAPGSTRVVVGPPGIGLWRLEGYSGLQLSARLRIPGSTSSRQGDWVPILSRDSVHPANTTVEAQSLIAATGFLSDFGVFIAGQVAARCDARLLLADGTQVGPAHVLQLAPLSFHLFRNVPTDLVSGAQIADARVSIRCDQDFFVLSRTVNPQTGYVSIHTGATALGAGLPKPGEPTPPPPPPPPPPPSGNAPPTATQVERFTRSGSFFTPTLAEPYLDLELPVTPNVAFSELAVSFEVEHGGWDAVDPAGIVNLLYLTRGGFTGDVFALITARGPGKNVVRNQITVDLPQGQQLSRVTKTALQPGSTYHVDYLYAGQAGRWTLTISEAGVPIVNLAGPTTGPIWTKGATWTILLSDAPSPGHVSSLGWSYRDLSVEWRP